MLSNKEIENKIRKELEGRVEFIYFINSTVGDRIWFFDGINFVIRKGVSMSEVYIKVSPNDIEVINGTIEPSDVVIPQSNLALFIHAPSIKNGVNIDEMVKEIKSVMVGNRDIIIANALTDTVRESFNAQDFYTKLKIKLEMLEEFELYKLNPPELFKEIVDILNINDICKDGGTKTFVIDNECVMKSYEGRDECMTVRFPLNLYGLFGFSNLLTVFANSISDEPDIAFREYMASSVTLTPS